MHDKTLYITLQCHLLQCKVIYYNVMTIYETSGKIMLNIHAMSGIIMQLQYYKMQNNTIKCKTMPWKSMACQVLQCNNSAIQYNTMSFHDNACNVRYYNAITMPYKQTQCLSMTMHAMSGITMQ